MMTLLRLQIDVDRRDRIGRWQVKTLLCLVLVLRSSLGN